MKFENAINVIDWNDLHGKQLTMIFSEDEITGKKLLAGKDENGIIYVLTEIA